MRHKLSSRMRSGIEFHHVLIFLTSLVSAALASRAEPGLTWWQRGLNALCGFCIAGLTGMGLHEAGGGQWWCGGAAYVTGYIGSDLMSALQMAVYKAKPDIISFLKRVLGLIWFWRTGQDNDAK